MRRKSILCAFCAAFALAGLPASAFLASNGLVVEQRGDGFFVPYRGKSGARDFWCAAAEYARSKLGAPGTQIIYRTSEPPRRSGEGIGFSLSPAQAVNRTGLFALGTHQGGGLTLATARNLCAVERLLRR